MTTRNQSIKWHCRNSILSLGPQPLIMGILNVTPDSFSDGGKYSDTAQAVTQGLKMMDDGASIIDIGGESTRPGAETVSVSEELDRVIPVIEQLSDKSNAIISIDTTKAEVADAAIEAGAHIINDISAMTADDRMPDIARNTKAGVILMHMQGTPETMQSKPEYVNVVSDVTNYLSDRIKDLTSRGLSKDALAIDPGIGFGKTLEHNLELISATNTLISLDVPVVVGLSRKSFIGKLTGNTVDNRLAGSLAGLVYCVLNGAHVMRVHDVKESCDAVNVAMKLAEIEKCGKT